MTRAELFKIAFGVSSPVFLTIPSGKEKEEREILYNGIKLKKDELAEYTAGDEKVYSDFGTEVVFPVYFGAGEYWSNRDILARYSVPEYNYNPDVPMSHAINSIPVITDTIRKVKAKQRMEEFRLPNATMIDVSREKIMTKTNMPMGGTVKEIFGFDDWQIRIRMLCVAEKNRGMTGQEISNEVIKWFSLADSIKVYGRPFIDRDIFEIVLTNIDIKSITGSPDTVAIEMSAISEIPFTLKQPGIVFHNNKQTSDFLTMMQNLDINK